MTTLWLGRIEALSPRPARIAARPARIHIIGCGQDRSGISEACEDCVPACEEGIDSINGVDRSGLEVCLGGENFNSENSVWLDPSVRVRRQPEVTMDIFLEYFMVVETTDSLSTKYPC
ncbi:unnamed protein product [Prunus armeniaca]